MCGSFVLQMMHELGMRLRVRAVLLWTGLTMLVVVLHGIHCQPRVGGEVPVETRS